MPSAFALPPPFAARAAPPLRASPAPLARRVRMCSRAAPPARRVCRICKTRFDPSRNGPRSCRHHPELFSGRLLRVEPTETSGLAFFYDCCGATDAAAPGCTYGTHASYDD